MPTAELWKAVALSCNFDPVPVARSFESEWEHEDKFHRRLEIAKAHAVDGTFPLAESSLDSEHVERWRVRLLEFAVWAVRQEWKTPPQFKELASKRPITEGKDKPKRLRLPKQFIDTGKPTAATKPLQRSQAQEQEIMRVIRDLGYSPKALPKREEGKSGVKAKVRAATNFSPRVFEKAWQRLRKQDNIGER